MLSSRFMSLRAPVRRGPSILRPNLAQRSFQSCRVLAASKESKIHDENRAEEAEAAKQEQLKKSKQGINEWDDRLASDSEADVKADRGEYKDAKDTIRELEQETAKAAQEEHDKGKGQ